MGVLFPLEDRIYQSVESHNSAFLPLSNNAQRLLDQDLGKEKAVRLERQEVVLYKPQVNNRCQNGVLYAETPFDLQGVQTHHPIFQTKIE